MLHNDINKITTYHDCPVGDSLEFMTLDNSIDNNVQVSHQQHCAVTAYIHIDDLCKHSLATLRGVKREIKKILETSIGAPFSCIIVQYVYLAFSVFEIVYEHNGVMVPGLTNKNRDQCDKDVMLWYGGTRVKCGIVNVEIWLEPDASGVFEERHCSQRRDIWNQTSNLKGHPK